MDPASARSMKLAASRAVWSALTVSTSVVMTSLIFMGPSSIGIARKTNAVARPFQS
jgi:hypothetical protein